MQRYLIPILQAPPSPGSDHLQQVWIFLERNGTHLISVEGGVDDESATEASAIAAANEFCEVNELSQVAPPFCVDAYVFAPIDPADKDLRNFYSWDEIQPGSSPSCEVWRPFLWVRSPGSDTADSDSWGVNALLKGIVIGEQVSHSVYSVLLAYWKGRNRAEVQEAP